MKLRTLSHIQAKQLVNRAKHWSPIGSNEGSLDHSTPGGTADNGGARDSVNMNNSRPYGSPVVTLKEKIDSHYSSGHTNGSSCSCHLDSFLQHTTLTATSAFSGPSRCNTGHVSRHCLSLSRHCLSLSRHCLSLSRHRLSLSRHCLSLSHHCLSLSRHCLSLSHHCLSLSRHCLSLTSRGTCINMGPKSCGQRFFIFCQTDI